MKIQITIPARRLTIEKCPVHDNCYTVREGERYIDRLTWDELIGFVAYVTCPKGDGWTDLTLWPLRTLDEHQQRMLGYEPESWQEEREIP